MYHYVPYLHYRPLLCFVLHTLLYTQYCTVYTGVIVITFNCKVYFNFKWLNLCSLCFSFTLYLLKICEICGTFIFYYFPYFTKCIIKLKLKYYILYLTLPKNCLISLRYKYFFLFYTFPSQKNIFIFVQYYLSKSVNFFMIFFHCPNFMRKRYKMSLLCKGK